MRPSEPSRDDTDDSLLDRLHDEEVRLRDLVSLWLIAIVYTTAVTGLLVLISRWQ